MPNHPRCVYHHLHLPYRGRFLGKTAPALWLGFLAHPHLRSSGLGLSMCPSRPGGLITAQQLLRVAVLAGAEAEGSLFAIIKARRRTKRRPRPNRSHAPSTIPAAAAPKPAAVFSPQKKTEVRKAMAVEKVAGSTFHLSLIIHHSSFQNSRPCGHFGKCTLCNPAFLDTTYRTTFHSST